VVIRHAQISDLRRIQSIYASARCFMAAHGNPDQWRNGYPTEELLKQDLSEKRLYVCVENGEIYAVFVLLLGEEPTYRVIEGKWLNDMPYATLHRVASSGEKSAMMDFIVQWSLTQCDTLRGDTHEKNLPMQLAFERNGFVRCGIIHVADGTPRIAYLRPSNT